jgi:hypothetical protein
MVELALLHSHSHFSSAAKDFRGLFRRGVTMDSVLQDCYMVFVRDPSVQMDRPDAAERVIATCNSYDEAVKARDALRRPGQTCIIRCVSETGGGD